MELKWNTNLWYIGWIQGIEVDYRIRYGILF